MRIKIIIATALLAIALIAGCLVASLSLFTRDSADSSAALIACAALCIALLFVVVCALNWDFNSRLVRLTVSVERSYRRQLAANNQAGNATAAQPANQGAGNGPVQFQQNKSDAADDCQ